MYSCKFPHCGIFFFFFFFIIEKMLDINFAGQWFSSFVWWFWLDGWRLSVLLHHFTDFCVINVSCCCRLTLRSRLHGEEKQVRVLRPQVEKHWVRLSSLIRAPVSIKTPLVLDTEEPISDILMIMIKIIVMMLMMMMMIELCSPAAEAPNGMVIPDRTGSKSQWPNWKIGRWFTSSGCQSWWWFRVLVEI